MKDRLIIAGNWKMNKTPAESIDFIKALDREIFALENRAAGKGVDIVVFPPFTSLYPVKDLSTRIKLGAQNIFFEEKGAFTGEISPIMLKNLVEYVLIGHSERRQKFSETDTDINRKLKTALRFDFFPLLCLGETLEERQASRTFSRLADQLDKGLQGLVAADIDRLSLAYEPVWAIGTGVNATPGQAQEVHAWLRGKLKERTAAWQTIPILYGGSVTPDNSFQILSQEDIDGVLVGGASLKSESFFAIIDHSYKIVVR